MVPENWYRDPIVSCIYKILPVKVFISGGELNPFLWCVFTQNRDNILGKIARSQSIIKMSSHTLLTFVKNHKFDNDYT